MIFKRSSQDVERPPARSLPRALEPLLEPLSGIYLAGYALRRFAYAARLRQSRRLPCKVVSVGNITVGGTGKTPFVETLAQIVQEHGKQVAILSRGYGREKEGGTPRIVSDGKTVLLDWRQAGDEPYLLAGNLPGAPVIVGSDRYRAGTVAVERFSPDLLILDDGFQHWGLGRDCDIVLLDARKPLASLRLLPRGSLREPVSALQRATAFLLTHCNLATDIQDFINALRNIAGDKPVFRTRHEASEIRSVGAGKSLTLQEIRGRKIVLVSGIAQPETFEATVRELGGNITHHIRHADHYVYSARDVDDLRSAIVAQSADMALTTQKDAVKLRNLVSDSLPLHYVKINVGFESEGDRERLWRVLCLNLGWS